MSEQTGRAVIVFGVAAVLLDIASGAWPWLLWVALGCVAIIFLIVLLETRP